MLRADIDVRPATLSIVACAHPDHAFIAGKFDIRSALSDRLAACHDKCAIGNDRHAHCIDTIFRLLEHLFLVATLIG